MPLASSPKSHTDTEIDSPRNKAPIVIALAGVPNAGKTSLFNALTGMNYKVANYPGVTVEKKEGHCNLSNLGQATVVDLPGTYSLFGGSPDENIAVDFLLGALTKEPPPDVIICVADACNLDRNLYLASQLLDSGYPVILALTMNDIAIGRGIKIRRELLSRALGIAVVDISGRSKTNIELLKNEIVKAATNSQKVKRYSWCDNRQYTESAEKLAKTYLEAEQTSLHPNNLATIGIGLLSGARQSRDSDVKQIVHDTRDKLSNVGISPGTYETEKRYQWVSKVIKSSVAFASNASESKTARIDRVVTHRLWGSIIFVLIMGTMFQSIFSWASVPMDFIDAMVGQLQDFLVTLLPVSELRDLIINGIVTGVGAVIIFVPQIAILYFFISILEESGYLTRAAFLLDRILRKVGLQGRSFVPMLSSFACAVPGIMSTRSIPSFSDRMTTIMVAPLMSCSARLPVYTLLIAAFIPEQTMFGFFSLQGLVFLSLYLLGIIGAAFIAMLCKRTIFKDAPTHFVMEMPPYRRPLLANVFRTAWEKSWIFVKQAGTVIMACSIVLWFLATYPKTDNAGQIETVKGSYAGQLGQFIEPVIKPLGFDWKIGVGIISSFAAREVFVSSLALVNNLEDVDETSHSLISSIRNAKDPETGVPAYTALTAISLMVFFVFSCQCMSTLAICRRETGSWKWSAIMFTYMTVLAYVASLLTYQIGLRLF